MIRPLFQLDNHFPAPLASATPVRLRRSRPTHLENLALRQLAVFKRTVTRPPLRRTDRLFWVGLATVWAGSRQSLVIVTPNTVPRLRGSGVRADELFQSVPGRRRRTSSKKIAASNRRPRRPRTSAQRTTTPTIVIRVVRLPSGRPKVICMRLMTGSGCGVWKRMPALERSTMRLSMVLPPKVNRSRTQQRPAGPACARWLSCDPDS